MKAAIGKCMKKKSENSNDSKSRDLAALNILRAILRNSETGNLNSQPEINK